MLKLTQTEDKCNKQGTVQSLTQTNLTEMKRRFDDKLAELESQLRRIESTRALAPTYNTEQTIQAVSEPVVTKTEEKSAKKPKKKMQ